MKWGASPVAAGGALRVYIINFGGNQSLSPFIDYEGKMVDTETERLQKILQGAFAGPPTPLKDIPTRDGEARKLERKSPQRRRRRQRKNRAA